MANPNAENEKKAVAPASKAGAKKRRRRVRGVPAALVAVLVVCSLFLGGLFGYAAANRTNTSPARATTRISGCSTTAALRTSSTT